MGERVPQSSNDEALLQRGVQVLTPEREFIESWAIVTALEGLKATFVADQISDEDRLVAQEIEFTLSHDPDILDSTASAERDAYKDAGYENEVEGLNLLKKNFFRGIGDHGQASIVVITRKDKTIGLVALFGAGTHLGQQFAEAAQGFAAEMPLIICRKIFAPKANEHQLKGLTTRTLETVLRALAQVHPNGYIVQTVLLPASYRIVNRDIVPNLGARLLLEEQNREQMRVNICAYIPHQGNQ